ncbi:MAG: S41 family peptidase [Planctomyces sp.]|nr:S41 family peptidase [Planctomyces sp.]
MTARTFDFRKNFMAGLMMLVAAFAVTATATDDVQAADLAPTPASSHTVVVPVAGATATENAALIVLAEFHPEVGIGPPYLRTAVRPANELGIGDPWNATPAPGGWTPQPTQPAGWDGGNALPGQAPWTNPAPVAPTEPDSNLTRIRGRYTDSRMLGYLGQVTFNQVASLLNETSRLIDTRHVNPPGYEVRTAAALRGLADAVTLPEFLSANRINPSPTAIQGLRQELLQMAQSQPARQSSEALGLMQWAAEVSQQRIGLRREAAGLEFVNSMLDSLDRYSSFVPSRTQFGPSASLEERIVGIGVELKTDADGVLVTGVIAGGPAHGAGVQKGDVIIAVNNRQLRGMSLNQAADLIGGPAGSTVSLTLVRQGRSLSMNMQRRQVYVSSVVDTKFLDSQRKVGYVRVKQFSESTTNDLLKELWSLHNAGMESLVLDLRGNPGGLLSVAVDVCDIFLPSGTIVSTRGRTQSDNSVFSAKWQETWKTPLVVLIDENSASASEIFAAAIQENGRGMVVGRRSYGKGSVQTHFPLQSAAGELKLTTAAFYGPSGRVMAGAGVSPDHNVAKAPGAIDVDDARDPDLHAALQIVRTGRPAQLAEQAGR